MAVGIPTLLTSGSDAVDRSVYQTLSITPTAGAIVIAALVTMKATTPDLPSVSGCNLTWSGNITNKLWNTIASPTRRVQANWGTGESPTSGVLSFSYGVNQDQCYWIIWEIPDANIATPIVSGSPASDGTDTAGQTASVALPDLASAGNALFTVTSIADGDTMAARTNWTEIAEVLSTIGLQAQYRLGANDDGSTTWTGNNRWGMIGFEVAEASAGATRGMPFGRGTAFAGGRTLQGNLR